jgi:trypsin
VLLQRVGQTGQYGLHCSANVINATTVITAAHCVVDEGVLAPASAYQVQAGGVQENQPGVQVVPAAAIAVHPNYRGFEFGYDVAVIALAAPLNLGTPFVQPVALPKAKTYVRAGKPLAFFGWGQTESGQPQGLRGMTTRAISPALCAPGVPGVMCAFNRAAAPCPGDSGGGLIRTTKAGVREIVGLDSFGGAKCQPGQPDGFADLTQPSLNQWLVGTINGQAVKPPAGPRASKRPTVQRVSRYNRRLRCSSARWSGKPKVRTTWLYESGKVIARTKGSTFTARRKDIGKLILCQANASNRGGTASVISRRGYRFFS